MKIFPAYNETITHEEVVMFDNCNECPFYINDKTKADTFNSTSSHWRVYEMINKDGNLCGYSFCSYLTKIIYDLNKCKEKIPVRLIKNKNT